MDTIARMTHQHARDAFSSLLQRHAGIVFKVANSYARSLDDRDDLAQEIAAQLWHAWPKYDPARSFSTWMYRVALNVSISQVRGETLRRRHHVAYEPDLHLGEVAPHDHEAEEQNALLQQAMQALDPMSRALLLMHLDERSHREIAEVLGISESNVATKFSRIKQRLRAALAHA